MQHKLAGDEEFIMQDLALNKVLVRNDGNAALPKMFDIFSAIYANTRHLFQAMTHDVVADDLENHKALLEALRRRDEEQVYARLQDTYTRLPDLVVDTPTVKVVAEEKLANADRL